jgi:hypothetical protein
VATVSKVHPADPDIETESRPRKETRVLNMPCLCVGGRALAMIIMYLWIHNQQLLHAMRHVVLRHG